MHSSQDVSVLWLLLLQKEEIVDALKNAVNVTVEAAAQVNATVERLKQVGWTLANLNT